MEWKIKDKDKDKDKVKITMLKDENDVIVPSKFWKA
jgi:hypothetical protein